MRTSRILIAVAITAIVAAIAVYAYSYSGADHAAPSTSPVNPGYCAFNGTTYSSFNKTVSGNFSVSAYVNFSRPGILISQGEGNNLHAEWYLGIGGETGYMFSFGVFSNASTGNGTTFGWKFATSTIRYGKWYEVTGVYNTSDVVLYINGTPVSETATPYPPINDSHVIFIGRRTSAFYVNGTPSFEYFKGEAKYIRVFNMSLSPTQVSELANGTLREKPFLSDCSAFFNPATSSQ